MSQGILAGPFGTPFRIEGTSHVGQIPRGISIQRTAYSIIVQTGPRRQIAWFAPDTPLTSVYVPLYRGVDAISRSFSQGHNLNFSRYSAWWAFDFVNNWMQLRYSTMSTEDVYPRIEAWQDDIDRQRRAVEEEKEGPHLAAWQASLQENLVADWWKLADSLVVKYNDGYMNIPRVGEKIGYPEFFTDMIGFSNDVHPVWVQPAAKPQSSLDAYVSPSTWLPRTWDSYSHTWLADSTRQVADSHHLIIALACLAQFSVGVVVGAVWERRQQGAKTNISNGFTRLP